METQQLKCFLAVAKYKGFSQAANKVFRTQPAISLQIKALEDELKVKLFDRLGPRKVELTEEGKTLFELASPLLEDFNSLKDRFHEACGKTQSGSVRIATHTSVMVYLLPETIKKFKKEFPICDLSIVNRGKKEIVSMVLNGEADIGICSLSDVPSNIEYKVFARFKRLLIAPKDHPLSKKNGISPKNIAQYPLIIPPQGSNTRSVIERVFEQNELTPNITMEVTGRQAIKTYVEMALGISVINEFYLTGEDKKKIFIKDLSNFFGEAERGILTRKGRYLSNPVKNFIKAVHSQFH